MESSILSASQTLIDMDISSTAREKCISVFSHDPDMCIKNDLQIDDPIEVFATACLDRCSV